MHSKSKMYQMTLFIKKVIYKKMIIINTHQKILNCNIFIKFSWVSIPPNGPWLMPSASQYLLLVLYNVQA